MLIKFLANRTPNPKAHLKTVEKEFAKSGIKLDFEIEKTDLEIVWDRTWGSPVYTDANWIYSLSDGNLILGINEKDWKTEKGGYKHTPRNGRYAIETKVRTGKVKSGKPWLVHSISHEISHMLFQMERIKLGLYDKIDQTHNYLNVRNPKWQLKECLAHLDQQFIKTL